ncbi:hypothetical protein NVV93_02725 [Pseudomonas sp. LS44]|uniref:hypothetical protein n=1 Tax=Pseudomonas sp. LS44 TaxID=1357074 RepID=UPI00215AD8B3|nr:hypothetical protein [Pseudomonas sp. LS44]UVE18335.1 hypothetical protein NVV93_02725 [Pseudomonas sp. LS44]
MTLQKRQSPAATGLCRNSSERQNVTTDASSREVRLIADILEQSEYQSGRQQFDGDTTQYRNALETARVVARQIRAHLSPQGGQHE